VDALGKFCVDSGTGNGVKEALGLAVGFRVELLRGT